MMVKSIKTTVEKRVRKSMMAFLEGDQNLSWAISVITDRNYGTVDKETLITIFDRLNDYGDKNRFAELQNKCRELNLI